MCAFVQNGSFRSTKQGLGKEQARAPAHSPIFNRNPLITHVGSARLKLSKQADVLLQKRLSTSRHASSEDASDKLVENHSDDARTSSCTSSQLQHTQGEKFTENMTWPTSSALEMSMDYMRTSALLPSHTKAMSVPSLPLSKSFTSSSGMHGGSGDKPNSSLALSARSTRQEEFAYLERLLSRRNTKEDSANTSPLSEHRDKALQHHTSAANRPPQTAMPGFGRLKSLPGDRERRQVFTWPETHTSGSPRTKGGGHNNTAAAAMGLRHRPLARSKYEPLYDATASRSMQSFACGGIAALCRYTSKLFILSLNRV
jgi:hypothetical protein